MGCGVDRIGTIRAQPSTARMTVLLAFGVGLQVGWLAVGCELGTDRNAEASGKSVRAAQYVRMSTEHQKYSTENQAEAMQQYAARRGIEIVCTDADQGKSG